ncbi:MAG: hypothetical protein IPK26_29105 [Planctomycetes bacterium]|nr:hypothetical protein [Planctomycetota bacterium]
MAKKLGAKDFGGAFAECKKLLTDGKLSAEAQAQAEKLCTEIEGKAATLVDHGIDRLAAGDPFAAFEAFDAVARGYAKVPRAEEATGKLQELAKDPKLKREIAAGQKLSAAQKFDQNRDYDKAHKDAGDRQYVQRYQGGQDRGRGRVGDREERPARLSARLRRLRRRQRRLPGAQEEAVAIGGRTAQESGAVCRNSAWTEFRT